jgi:hypothetical protein
VPLAPAPTIALPPATLTRNATTGDVTLEVKLSPPIHPHQQVWLYLGGIGAPSAVGAAVTPNAKAVLPSVASGDQWVRAQVDGVMSLLTISGTPPKYDATQTVSVPA